MCSMLDASESERADTCLTRKISLLYAENMTTESKNVRVKDVVNMPEGRFLPS